MKDRPILFSAPMVKAILEGRKTQTRRILKTGNDDGGWSPDDVPQLGFIIEPKNHPKQGKFGVFVKRKFDGFVENDIIVSPYGRPGDRIWVRENGWERPHRTEKMMREGADTWLPYYYDADGLCQQDKDDFKAWGFKRRPSIHMPRWASRILLEVTSVRVERLQDISEDDAKAEGVYPDVGLRGDDDIMVPVIMDKMSREAMFNNDIKPPVFGSAPLARFMLLWDSINNTHPNNWNANPWVWVVEFKVIERG